MKKEEVILTATPKIGKQNKYYSGERLFKAINKAMNI